MTTVIGRELDRLMALHGLETFADLSRASGVPYATIKALTYREKAYMARKTAEKLGAVLDVFPEHLMHLCGQRKAEPNNKDKRTICWTCRNAVPNGKNGCTWSREYEPVKGWTADKTAISWCVIECPKYEEG